MPWWAWSVLGLVLLVITGIFSWSWLVEKMENSVLVSLDATSLKVEHEENDDRPEGLLGVGLTALINPDALTGNLVVSVDAKIQNDSWFDLKVVEVVFQILVNKTQFASGSAGISSKNRSVPSGKSVTLPLKTSIPIATTGLKGILQFPRVLSGELELTIQGEVTVESWLGTFTHSFALSGMEIALQLRPLLKNKLKE